MILNRHSASCTAAPAACQFELKGCDGVHVIQLCSWILLGPCHSSNQGSLLRCTCGALLCVGAEGSEMVQEMWSHELSQSPGALLAAADIADANVLVHMSDGAPLLLTLNSQTLLLEAGAQPGLSALLPAGAHVTACCLYTDGCGWFESQLAGQGQSQLSGPVQREAGQAQGEAEAAISGSGSGSGGKVYAVLCVHGGGVVLVALPEQEVVFRSGQLGMGQRMLSHESGSFMQGGDGGVDVVEVRMACFGGAVARPGATRGGGSVPVCEAPVLLALTSEHGLLVRGCLCACVPVHVFLWGCSVY